MEIKPRPQPLNIHYSKTHQDSRIILFQGSKTGGLIHQKDLIDLELGI